MSISRLNLGQFMSFDPDTGKPLALGFVHTYIAGTTTDKAAYTDSTGATALANPVPLNAMGQATIYLDGIYDLVIKDANLVTVQTLTGVGGAIDETDVQALINASLPTITTFIQTLLDDFTATAARATIGATSAAVSEVVTLEWDFDNRLSLVNLNDGPIDLNKWRFESAGVTGNFHLNMLDDSNNVLDTALNISHDAIGVLQWTFKVQGTQSLQLNETSVEVNGANMWADRQTIVDDAVGVFTPPTNSGVCILTCAPTSGTDHASFSDKFHYHTGASTPSTESISPSIATYSSDVEHSTGILAGTTGTDAKVTISPQADGTIQIENRTGGDRIFRAFFF